MADTTTGAADLIGKRAHELLKEEPNYDQLADDKFPIGFQVVGYNNEEPKVIVVEVGKTVKKTEQTEMAPAFCGQPQVVEALSDLYSKKEQGGLPAFNIFSLQDAIDYAEFLIRITADYQRFSNQMATVGGDTDVALITPFDGFRWIKQKPLNRIVDRRRSL